jgi:acyl-coenzyme A thioesterase PaaI-like protein
MDSKKDIDYFQDHMPGNICFGCGRHNHEGLQISSYWDGAEAVCIWKSQEKYQGWQGILNGGILASLFDCHAMCTAMAAAYKSEQRDLDSEPVYHYATAHLSIDYLKPTPNDLPIEIRAIVKEQKNRKTIIECRALSNGVVTATANVVGVRVFDSSKGENRFIKNRGGKE